MVGGRSVEAWVDGGGNGWFRETEDNICGTECGLIVLLICDNTFRVKWWVWFVYLTLITTLEGGGE